MAPKILTLIFGLLALAGLIMSIATIPTYGAKAVFSTVMCFAICVGFGYFIWKDWFLKK